MNQHLWEDDNCCFACGQNNLDGLRVPWIVNGTAMTGEFVSPKKFQGWKGFVHGGILATLLDEAMTRLATVLYGKAVTAELTVRYLAPAPVGEKLFVCGEVVKEARKLVEMKAVIHLRNPEERVLAHAFGKIMKI